MNREYTEVLEEQHINGSTGYYLYDPRGSVTGITNEEGQVYQSYRYSASGEITFGASRQENEYTYNGESYNPNIENYFDLGIFERGWVVFEPQK